MTLKEIKADAETMGVKYPHYYSEETIRQHYANLCAARDKKPETEEEKAKREAAEKEKAEAEKASRKRGKRK